MRLSSKFSGLMMVCCLASILYGVQLLFSLEGMTPGLRICICLMFYGPVSFLLNALFLKRERTVIQTVVVNGVIAALTLLGVFVCFGTGGGRQIAVTLCFYLFLTYYSVRLNLRAPRQNELILMLDISVLMLILIAVILPTVDHSLLDGIPIFVGFLCVLLGLMCFRLHSFRLWAVSGCLLAMLLFLSGVLIALAKPFGRLLTFVFGGIVSGLQYLGLQIERILLYLTSFLKTDSYEAVSGESFGIPSGAMETAQKFQDGMGIIIGLIILTFLLFVLIMALRVFGKSGIGGKKLVPEKKMQNHSPSFWNALRNWIREIGEKVYYSILVIRRRKTPWGFYYLLLFVTGRGRLGIKPGETPRCYLLRLSEQLRDYGGELHAIIPEIDRALFARNVAPITVQISGKILLETLTIARFRR